MGVRLVKELAAQQRGFTLIELMIVIAIMSVLLSLAIPSYQNYTIRAKVTESLSLMGAAKLAVEETCQTDRSANITTSSGYVFSPTTYVSSIQIFGTCTDSIIIAWTQDTGADTNPVAILIKATSTQLVQQLGNVGISPGSAHSWGCVIGASSPAHSPGQCRYDPNIN